MKTKIMLTPIIIQLEGIFFRKYQIPIMFLSERVPPEHWVEYPAI